MKGREGDRKTAQTGNFPNHFCRSGAPEKLGLLVDTRGRKYGVSATAILDAVAA
jgi:hypothetical protein